MSELASENRKRAGPNMSCPICVEDRSWRLAYRQDPEVDAWRRQVGDVENYFWSLCRRCANAYPSVTPRSDVLDFVWRSNRDVGKFDVSVDAETVRASRIRMSQQWAARSYSMLAPLHAGSPGRFLDIACGLGQTVKLFQDNGWEASGIDVDASTKAFHQQLGIDTRIGRIEDIGIDGQFDIIHIAHAIYFVSDPMSFLRKIRVHLAPGGIFAVLISDFLAFTDPEYPAYFHTFYPTGNSMRYALALAGFDSSPARTCKGSIFIAARPGRGALPSIRPRLIWLAFATKKLRYQLLGRAYLAARRVAKQVIGPN